MTAEAIAFSPWRLPQEAADHLRISLSTFKRHVAPHIPCKKIGSIKIYNVKDLDGWDEIDKATSSGPGAAAESSTSPAPHPTGALCIGPLERAQAKRLRKGCR